WHAYARQEFPPAVTRGDVPPPPRGRRSGKAAGDDRRPLCDRELVTRATEGGAARGDRRLCGEDGRHARRSRSRAGSGVARDVDAAAEIPAAQTLRRGEIFWADVDP